MQQPQPPNPEERRSTTPWGEFLDAWPRGAQLAAAALAGSLLTLIIVQARNFFPSAGRPLQIEKTSPAFFRINLNEADRATLAQIPGVGEKLAAKIEAYRQEQGRIEDLRQLLEIPGVGPATLERLRPWVQVEGNRSSIVRPASGLATRPVTLTGSVKKPESPPSEAPPDEQPASKKLRDLTEPVPINTATEEDLQKLPGIGPQRARQIITERNRAPFRDLEDLRRIPGFGPKRLENLRPLIILNSSAEADKKRPNTHDRTRPKEDSSVDGARDDGSI